MLRLILCCFAATLALAIAGCGGSNSSNSTAADTTGTTTTPAKTSTTPQTIKDTLPEPKGLGAHPGAKVDELIIKDNVKGTGAVLHAGDTGTFNFVGGSYATGKVFESTWKNRKPFTSVIDHGVVIDGWWQGLAGMRVGGRRTIVIPESLGFVGNTNPKVQGITWFIVDLLGVKAAQPAGVGGGQSAGS